MDWWCTETSQNCSAMTLISYFHDSGKWLRLSSCSGTTNLDLRLSHATPLWSVEFKFFLYRALFMISCCHLVPVPTSSQGSATVLSTRIFPTTCWVWSSCRFLWFCLWIFHARVSHFGSIWEALNYACCFYLALWPQSGVWEVRVLLTILSLYFFWVFFLFDLWKSWHYCCSSHNWEVSWHLTSALLQVQCLSFRPIFI